MLESPLSFSSIFFGEPRRYERRKSLKTKPNAKSYRSIVWLITCKVLRSRFLSLFLAFSALLNQRNAKNNQRQSKKNEEKIVTQSSIISVKPIPKRPEREQKSRRKSKVRSTFIHLTNALVHVTRIARIDNRLLTILPEIIRISTRFAYPCLFLVSNY